MLQEVKVSTMATRNPAVAPVEVGSLSDNLPLFTRFYTSNTVGNVSPDFWLEPSTVLTMNVS